MRTVKFILGGVDFKWGCGNLHLEGVGFKVGDGDLVLDGLYFKLGSRDSILEGVSFNLGWMGEANFQLVGVCISRLYKRTRHTQTPNLHKSHT